MVMPWEVRDFPIFFLLFFFYSSNLSLIRS